MHGAEPADHLLGLCPGQSAAPGAHSQRAVAHGEAPPSEEKGSSSSCHKAWNSARACGSPAACFRPMRGACSSLRSSRWANCSMRARWAG
jgi:hypothetical protein